MGNKESKTDAQSNMAAFDTWLNQRLQQYVEDLETMVLDVKVTEETKKDISEAVDTMLLNIFKEAERIDRRFKVKKSGLMKVGDFYEDSQIICLDEIEVFCVLENLSGENMIQMENTTTEYFETLHVSVKEECVSEYEDWLSENGRKQGLLDGEKMAARAYDVVLAAVSQLRKQTKDIVYKKHGYLELLDDNEILKRGSSICLKFNWTGSFFLMVSVTPVLRIYNTESYILYDEALSEMVFDAVNECGSLLLVPEPENDTESYFRLSFAHIEAYLMNKDVSITHRQVYRILQFLVNGYEKKASCKHQLLSNEQVKTFVIMHDMTCGKKNTEGACVMNIINKMAAFLEEVASNDGKLFLSSIFVEHMNTFRRSASSVDKDIIKLNVSAMSKLTDHLVNDVGRAPVYMYTDIVSKLVPINQQILSADYHARKSRVDIAEEDSE